MLPDDPTIWRNKSALGFFYAKLDDAQHARPLLLEAADYWRSRVPAAQTELARTLNNLAEVARNKGGYAEALKYLEEAVPICQRIYAADDVRLAEVYSNLAGVLSAQGRYKAAIDQYRQCDRRFAARVQAPPPTGHAELLATTLVNTAMLYKSQRQFHEAARYCCRSAGSAKATVADVDESWLMPFYTALASLYLAQDQAHPTGPPRPLGRPGPGGTIHPASPRPLPEISTCWSSRLGHSGAAARSDDSSPQGRARPGGNGAEQALELANRCRQASLAAKSLTYLAEIELRRGNARQRGRAGRRGPQNPRASAGLSRTCGSWPI